MGYKAGQTYFMDKKIKTNPKYANIPTTLNTGITVDKVKIVSDSEVRQRRMEIFNRISKPSLVKQLGIERYSESIYDLDFNQEVDEKSLKETSFHQEETKSQLSDMYSNFTGGTRQTLMTLKTVANEVVDINDETDFIVLDLRNPEEYEDYHIKDAESFPAPFVNRNSFKSHILQFKNKPNCLIIVYHSNEKHGIPVINVMAERGFENVYLLSGGIEEFSEQFPSYIVGRNKPKYNPKNAMKKQLSSKIEVNRQPDAMSMSKKNTGMLPSINGQKKQPNPSTAKGFRYDPSNRRTGSAALNRRNKADIFNDIPDPDSNMSVKTKNTLIKRGSRLGAGGSKRELSITEKPGNVYMNKESNQMMFRERKIGKIDKEITGKLTDAKGIIRYNN